MIGRKRRADRPARVARRRLNPDAFERAVAQQLAVADAVERDAAGKAQVAGAGLAGERAGKPQHHLFRHLLERGCDVHVALGEQLVGLAHRGAEQALEILVRHGQAGAIIEIVHVETESTVGFQIDEVIEEQIDVLRLAVGRKPHHLVFAGVDLEPKVIGQRRIEQAERVGKVQFLEDLEMIAAADAGGRRGPLPHSVHGEHRRLGKGRSEKSRGRVALMMLGKQQPFDIGAGAELLELVAQENFLKQLLLEP